jgi:hypothetical protein
MWICPRCSEQHEDQFKECWKCAGAEMHPEATAIAARPLPSAEPKLRPLSSILFRAGLGFVVGLIFGSAVSYRIGPAFWHSGLDYEWLNGVLVMGLGAGVVLGLLVGLYYWVAFPYEPAGEPSRTPHQRNS